MPPSEQTLLYCVSKPSGSPYFLFMTGWFRLLYSGRKDVKLILLIDSGEAIDNINNVIDFPA
jgi:hypothetical protein